MKIKYKPKYIYIILTNRHIIYGHHITSKVIFMSIEMSHSYFINVYR